MTIIKRMQEVLTENGVPPRSVRRQLSVDCGVTYEAARQWVLNPNTKIDADRIVKFSEKYRINQRWLTTGKGDKHLSVALKRGTDNKPGIEGAEVCDRVPLVALDALTEWNSTMSLSEIGALTEWIDTTGDLSQQAFAVRVTGDSMTAPAGKSLPEGAIVIIDPKGTPKSGSIVVAQIHHNQTPVLKEYVIDGPNRYLRSLNNLYSPIKMTDESRIIGVGIRMQLDL